jgi:hypothetical protein
VCKHFQRHTEDRKTCGNEENGQLVLSFEIVNFLKIISDIINELGRDLVTLE